MFLSLTIALEDKIVCYHLRAILTLLKLYWQLEDLREAQDVYYAAYSLGESIGLTIAELTLINSAVRAKEIA